MNQNAEYYYDLAIRSIEKNNRLDFKSATRVLIKLDNEKYNFTKLLWEIYDTENNDLQSDFVYILDWACKYYKCIISKYLDTFLRFSSQYEISDIFTCLINNGFEYQLLAQIIRKKEYQISGGPRDVRITFNNAEFHLSILQYEWFILNAEKCKLREFFSVIAPFVTNEIITALDRDMISTFSQGLFLFKMTEDTYSQNFRPLWTFFNKIKNPLQYATYAGTHHYRFILEYNIRPISCMLIMMKRKELNIPRCIVRVIYNYLIAK